MKILFTILALLPVLVFGQSVSRTELRATNTAIRSTINSLNSELNGIISRAVTNNHSSAILFGDDLEVVSQITAGSLDVANLARVGSLIVESNSFSSGTNGANWLIVTNEASFLGDTLVNSNLWFGIGSPFRVYAGTNDFVLSDNSGGIYDFLTYRKSLRKVSIGTLSYGFNLNVVTNIGVSYFDHFHPRANDTYDLGTSTLNWRAAYIDSITTALSSNTIVVVAPGGIIATGIIGSGLSYDVSTRTLTATGGTQNTNTLPVFRATNILAEVFSTFGDGSFPGYTEWFSTNGNDRVAFGANPTAVGTNFFRIDIGLGGMTAGQALQVFSRTVFGTTNFIVLTNATLAGSGDVTAASTFGTDNRVIRSDGTGKGVQSSGLTITDGNNLTGLQTLGVSDIDITGSIAQDQGTGTAVLGDTTVTTFTASNITAVTLAGTGNNIHVTPGGVFSRTNITGGSGAQVTNVSLFTGASTNLIIDLGLASTNHVVFTVGMLTNSHIVLSNELLRRYPVEIVWQQDTNGARTITSLRSTDGLIHTNAVLTLTTNANEMTKWVLSSAYFQSNVVVSAGESGGLVSTTTNLFVLGTRYTNSIRRAFVSSSVTLNAAAAGTAKVSLYVERVGVTNLITVAAGPLASLVTIEPLMQLVGPGEIYYFTDETSGTGASAALVANTASKVDL